MGVFPRVATEGHTGPAALTTHYSGGSRGRCVETMASGTSHLLPTQPFVLWVQQRADRQLLPRSSRHCPCTRRAQGTTPPYQSPSRRVPGPPEAHRLPQHPRRKPVAEACPKSIPSPIPSPIPNHPIPWQRLIGVSMSLRDFGGNQTHPSSTSQHVSRPPPGRTPPFQPRDRGLLPLPRAHPVCAPTGRTQP